MFKHNKLILYVLFKTHFICFFLLYKNERGKSSPTFRYRYEYDTRIPLTTLGSTKRRITIERVGEMRWLESLLT